ncbi:XdhC family protein [Alkalicoccus halolimnae]|uniref:XdhC family protein n=1 Tax=Alkalicoccus halolimnae TaxID=1667239 RepID=A0A5C7FHE1_9BACI|nr:XdhC family protein [Alkalicoccus halolimnae]TXF84597.1 XdhC family protein [Alkalicoccus halolimnae]
MNEMHGFLQAIRQKPDEKFVMATVVHVEGSAYRKEGAKMLIRRNGMETGLVSGGCLEEDLAHRAESVMKHGDPELHIYDMRREDDSGWGKGAGCNGCIYLFLERICWNEQLDVWKPILEKLEQGESVVTFRRGPPGKAELNSKEQEQVELQWKERKAASLLNWEEPYLLMEIYEPREKLFVFGGGRDAEPVVRQAAALDFDVIVVDPRPSRCHNAHFPDASGFECMSPRQFFKEQTITGESYVLVMTHSFEDDRTIMEHLLHRQDLAYLGILGPKKRTERLAGSTDLPDWLHSPIGLDIGADGPEEISISIAAELIQTRRQKKTESKPLQEVG